MNGVTALELVVWEFLIGQFLASKFNILIIRFVVFLL